MEKADTHPVYHFIQFKVANNLPPCQRSGLTMTRTSKTTKADKDNSKSSSVNGKKRSATKKNGKNGVSKGSTVYKSSRSTTSKTVTKKAVSAKSSIKNGKASTVIKGKVGRPKKAVSGSGSKSIVAKKKSVPVKNKKKYESAVQKVEKRDRMYIKNWEGNSDSEGSVDSGALEEDICFHCGQSTRDLDQDEWSNLVICDRCNGEFHLACMALDIVPRKGWICTHCKKDELEFYNLKYHCYKPDLYGLEDRQRKIGTSESRIDNERVPQFSIPKSKSPVEYCFSPSRPIDLAWTECLDKGFMSVQGVFNHDIMKKLTHGPCHRHTSTGRVAETWDGALRVIEKSLGSGSSCHNLIDRDGRYDLRLPDYVIKECGLLECLEPILERLRTIMGNPKPEVRTQNVVFAPVGSAPQPWHTDDSLSTLKHHRYFTILIHLNLIDDKCGGTEVWSRKYQRGDLIRNRPGDAFVFNGSMQHRGHGNEGQSHRLFYYASFSCRADANIGV